MSFEFRDGVRANAPLLILLAGGTGSGKTESAMRLATGLSGGKPFAVIDSENGRALHKADDYKFKHTTIDEP
ncbi:MAG: zeta toxin family protein, partial [Gemmatimonadaceae bacterium]|nr:zeta toxin family protein [Gemmatimonadaceae bacterium]